MGKAQLVLVVEDEEVVRQALIESLEMLNYQVLGAANGKEALQIIESHDGEIELVLSDLIMPGMGGADLFYSLQERDHSAPLILLSGHPLDRQLKELQAQGVVGWMLKPPTLEALAQVVAKALGGD